MIAKKERTGWYVNAIAVGKHVRPNEGGFSHYKNGFSHGYSSYEEGSIFHHQMNKANGHARTFYHSNLILCTFQMDRFQGIHYHTS